MGFDKRPTQIERPQRDPQNIMAHAVRPYPDPPPSTKVTAAFLARAPHKFTEHLRVDDPVVRRETLLSLRTYFAGHPKNVCMAVEAGLVEALTALLDNPTPEIRDGTAHIMSLIAVVPRGREAFIVCESVPKLLVLLDEEEGNIRANAVEALRIAAQEEAVAKNIIEVGGVQKMVADVEESEYPPLLEALYTVIAIVDGRDHALESRGLEVMTKLSKSEDPIVVELACQNLQRLCTPFEAKPEAITCGAIPAMIRILNPQEPISVRQAACAALMTITIDIDAKKLAIEQGAAPLVMQLLTEQSASVQLVAIKTVASLAEADRETFMQCVPVLDEIARNAPEDDELIIRSAKVATSLIKWRP
eukprot:CAMPEP_0114554284 /NCGR_PEP_ID=MMETSP0114-20121206/8129_1 /TAXON_ID=31324 /ORGANISM="Goniomonas sp, Strain m" /LENGTH=360 /DNA_ID=CAMNT_0001739323 /DNA_START=29 /DNA_END=1111 /DNA_ORIENTATION=+